MSSSSSSLSAADRAIYRTLFRIARVYDQYPILKLTFTRHTTTQKPNHEQPHHHHHQYMDAEDYFRNLFPGGVGGSSSTSNNSGAFWIRVQPHEDDDEDPLIHIPHSSHHHHHHQQQQHHRLSIDEYVYSHVLDDLLGSKGFYTPSVQFTDVLRAWFRNPHRRLRARGRGRGGRQAVQPAVLHTVAFEALRALSDHRAQLVSQDSELLERDIGSRSNNNQPHYQYLNRFREKIVRHDTPAVGRCLVAHPKHDYEHRHVCLLTEQLADGGWRGVVINPPPLPQQKQRQARKMHDPPVGMLVNGGKFAAAAAAAGATDGTAEAMNMPALLLDRVTDDVWWWTTSNKTETYSSVRARATLAAAEHGLSVNSVVRPFSASQYREWAPDELEEELEDGLWWIVEVPNEYVFVEDAILTTAADAKSVWKVVLWQLGGEYAVGTLI